MPAYKFEALDGVTVIVRDPTFGRRRMHVSEFRRYWSGVAIFASPRP